MGDAKLKRRPLRCKALIALAGAFACAAAPSAHAAGSDTDTMTVTATVVDACSVTANDLAFGNYNPVSSTPLDGATTLVITCTNGTGYTVSLNAGTGSGATVAARKMTETGGATLTYSLYRNAGRTNVWGVTGGSDTVAGAGTGAAQTLDVYGRAPINQTAIAGAYTDTIIATVAY